jgi:predicted AlkP superfamily phosphohydrolase/phosphomutase
MRIDSRKVFVLGLDGGSWSLLHRLMDEGYMPNLNRVCRDGASGTLQSTQPPYTGPAWVSCLTGVNPGKHGVFGFTSRQVGSRHRSLVSSQSIRAPRIFHYLEKAGRSSGLINVPVSYPVDRVNGFMIPCFLTPQGKDDFCHPPGLYKELLKDIGTYIINVRLADRTIDNEALLKRFVEDLLFCTKKRFEAMQVLWKRYNPDFFMIVFTCMDKLQHKFWKFMDPESPLYHTPMAERARPHLFQVYRYMDEIVGYITRSMDTDTTLYIVSDHGFGPAEKRVFLNKWLARQGLLHFKKGRAYLNALLYHFGLKKIRFYDHNIALSDHPLDECINYSKSRFYCSDVYEQGIYANISNSSPNASIVYDEERLKIKQKLLALKDPDTGKPFVDEVKFREEIYWGSCVNDAPDLMLKMQNYSYLLNKSIPVLGDKFVSIVEGPEGCHRPEGVFTAYGQDIQKRGDVAASIMDIAPTILHHFGLPIPKEMDGRILKEVFTSELVDTIQAEGEENELAWSIEGLHDVDYDREEEAEIKARLQDLGYFD